MMFPNVESSMLFSPQLFPVVMQYHSQRSTSHLLHSLFMSLYHHYYLYNMYIRPTVLFDQLPLEDPIAELLPTEFYELCGFWPGQFCEVVDNLSLLPDTITCPITQCAASKDLAFFLSLRHWKKAGGCLLCHEARMCLVHKNLPFCLFTSFSAL